MESKVVRNSQEIYFMPISKRINQQEQTLFTIRKNKSIKIIKCLHLCYYR